MGGSGKICANRLSNAIGQKCVAFGRAMTKVTSEAIGEIFVVTVLEQSFLKPSLIVDKNNPRRVSQKFL